MTDRGYIVHAPIGANFRNRYHRGVFLFFARENKHTIQSIIKIIMEKSIVSAEYPKANDAATGGLQVFNNPQFGEIRVTTDEQGEPLFCLADVCKALDLSNPRMVKSRLSQKGVSNSDTPTNGGIQSMTYINEPNLYKCVFQSRKSEASKFQDWVYEEVLPFIRKTGAYYSPVHSASNPKILEIEAQFYLADILSHRLRLNEASRLGMYQAIAQPYNIPVPEYVTSEGVMKSAKVLLKEIGSDMSSIAFNKLLVKHGYLEILTRPTSRGKHKPFPSITDKGRPYGQNMQSRHNQKETQPHWYSGRFKELYAIVTA